MWRLPAVVLVSSFVSALIGSAFPSAGLSSFHFCVCVFGAVCGGAHGESTLKHAAPGLHLTPKLLLMSLASGHLSFAVLLPHRAPVTCDVVRGERFR